MVMNLAQFQLTPAETAPILSTARNYSAVMNLGRQIPVSIAGARIPVINGQATATIVGENAVKPKYDPAVAYQSVARSKFALIAVASTEVARENPEGIIEIVQDQIASAFARALDRLALYGGVAGQGYVNQTTSAVELGTAAASAGGTYRDLVGALALQAHKTPARRTSGYVFDQKAEPTLLASVDTVGRPLWVDAQTGDNAAFVGSPGRVLGRPAYQVPDLAEGTDIGWAGDWDKVVWGVHVAPHFRIVLDASYTNGSGVLVSTTELNQVLVIGEFEAAAACIDPQSFVRLTDAADPVLS